MAAAGGCIFDEIRIITEAWGEFRAAAGLGITGQLETNLINQLVDIYIRTSWLF